MGNTKGNAEDMEQISIVLFGLSGDGKTNLLAALFRLMNHNGIQKKGVSYSLEFNNNVSFPKEVENLSKCFSEKNFFASSTTTAPEPFSLVLRIKKKEEYDCPILLGDYVGGSIDVFGVQGACDKEKEFSTREKELRQANVIWVLVDAIALARCCEQYDFDVVRCAEQMNAPSVNLTLSRIMNDKGHQGESVTILFLLTKTDASIFTEEPYKKYKGSGKFESLREMIKKIYQKVFSEVYYQVEKNQWSTAIVPVCVCGTGNVMTTIEGEKIKNTLKEAGKIEPEGIDTAFMYSIQRTFISKIAFLESELEDCKERIRKAEYFYRMSKDNDSEYKLSDIEQWLLEKEALRYKDKIRYNKKLLLARLQMKEEAIEYERIIADATESIEQKNKLEFQIEKLEEMRTLIEKGYQEEFAEKVFNKEESITEVKPKREVK